MLKKILFGTLVAAGLSAHAAAATEGVDYTVLPKEMPQVLHKDKVEVLEFFGYFCSYCKNLDPIILKHAKTFANDTYFYTSHVVWEEKRDNGLARLAAAVNQSGTKYSANPAIFKALFDEQIPLNEPEITSKWLAEQKSFNGKKVLAAYNGFGNKEQAKQMADRTVEYNITGTPTVIVGGKYRLEFPNGFAPAMKTLDELIDKVREERGMKKPAPKPKTPPVKSIGTTPAAAANR